MSRIEKIKEMLNTNGHDSFLLHALALELIKLGNDEDARQCFVDLLANEPGYVGSYYHLAKLYERTGQIDKAMATYEAGMHQAKAAGDQHSMNELRGALDELAD